ncbi:peroxisomal biogenesis factor 12 [Brevipalpus obovatus]|uniref:peroxisomal biogenesis factor 12 n=1 Tax=Brevipalpus obovatus TaxID=246614 RepID=UPI003D9E52EB
MKSFQPASIYDIIQEESLSRGLRNASEYLSQVLASNYPERFRLFAQYFDEIYLFADLIFQGLHLKVHSSSFPEYFFRLRRVTADHSSDGSLPSGKLLQSLIALTCLPYVRTKLDKLHEELDRQAFEGALNPRDKFGIYFHRNYPLLRSFWDLSSFVYQINYAVGRGKVNSPLLQLIGVCLVRRTPIDSSKSENSSLGMITKGLSYLLTGSALFIQFLDYWYGREDTRRSLASLEIPPPPPRRELPNCPPKMCPLCKQVRRDEAVLRTSGFLFCYSCIYDSIERHSKCPITGFPTNFDQIIRIYHQLPST